MPRSTWHVGRSDRGGCGVRHMGGRAEALGGFESLEMPFFLGLQARAPSVGSTFLPREGVELAEPPRGEPACGWELGFVLREAACCVSV